MQATSLLGTGLLGAFYYWFPKLTGKLLDERIVAFFPMHILGLAGMPRRVYTYAQGLGWEGLNQLSSFGVLLIAISLLMFLFNVIESLRNGERAGDNPWGASTLEWATTWAAARTSS